MTMKKLGGRLEYCLAGLSAAAAFLVYLPALQNGFINWDDDRYIYADPGIHAINAAFLKWAFSGFYFSNWHPITMISYALDYAVWGLDPLGYHLTNIVLHSINSFIVAVLAIRLIEAWEKTKALEAEGGGGGAFLEGNGKLIAGVAAGLLFGLHPLHVESVAWASERKDLLCALFFLLSIMAYIKYASIPHPGPLPYLLALAFFALALMSKPMAVSLPIVLLILDWFPLGRIFSFKSFRAAFFEKLPFIALSLGGSALAVMAQNTGGAIKSFKFAPLNVRALVAARALVLYLWKMVLPIDLVPYYPYPKDAALLSAAYLLPVACLSAITAFCLYCLKVAKNKKRKYGFCLFFPACWGFYIITLLPVLGLVQVGGQAMADRYTYLPSLGPFLMAGIFAAWAWKKAGSFKWERRLRIAGISAALLVVLSMSYLTFWQIGVWKNSLVFWDYVIEKEPGKVPEPYNNRGIVFEEMGQLERATADFNEAISLDPAAFRAHYNLGKVLMKTGRLDLALAEDDKTIALNPSYADSYNNRGIIFAMRQRFAMALTDFNKAILLNPDDAQAYYNRGKVYLTSGCGGLAAPDFRKACGMGEENACRALRENGF